MTTHIKLRPLAVHDSVSSQSGFNEACSSDVCPPVRAHCSLPSPARGKLVPAPPQQDTAGTSAAAEASGVSKLRSKLRRLLGAQSSSNSPASPAQKPSAIPPTPSTQTAALRCASTADLADRPSPHERPSSRVAISVPVSPSVVTTPSSGGGPRARFAGTPIAVPACSLSSTPPATPGSFSSASIPSPSGPRAGPIPPPTATPAGGRCPSAGSGRGSSLRRAVSFSPTATTFPPLSPPGVPSPPVGAHPPGVGGYGGSGGLPAAAAAPPRLSNSSSGNTFMSSASASTARMSSMVVVPEHETLPEVAAQGDYCVPISNNSIVVPTRSGGGAGGSGGCQLLDYAALRNGSVSAADADALPSPSPSTAAAAAAHNYDGAAYVTTSAATHLSYSGGADEAAHHPNFNHHQNLQQPQQQRTTSSSSSSTLIITSNGYGDAGAGGAAGSSGDTGLYAQSAPLAGGSGGGAGGGIMSSWSSDISPVGHGPFNNASAVAVAAAATLLEPATVVAAGLHLQLPLQQLRSTALRAGRAAGLESSRPLSSSSSASAAAAAVAAPSPRTAGHYALSITPGGGGLLPSPGTPLTHQHQQLPNHTSVPPLTRGMSAFSLLGSGGGGGGSRGGASTSSPWNTVGAVAGGGAAAVHAASAMAAGAAAAAGPAAPEAPPAAAATFAASSAAAAAAKQPAIRRAISTLDNSSRSHPEASSGPTGVLMALGASLPSEMQRQEWRIEDFTMLKRLYKGNYSAVHKALCRISMRLVVIKTYDTTRMTELARNHVKREASLHAPLEHDNILNLYVVFSQGPYVMLVEEVAEGGDLYHVLKSIPGHRLVEDRAVAGVLVPLLRALAHLHEQGICHRDIKLENILFGDRQHSRMLLADFGIAISLRQERAVTRAGTTEYMSPEQLRCPFKRHPEDNKDRADLHYGLGVDVWATGVLAYELLHGYPPFLGSHREETEALILSAEVQVAPQLSAGARDFVLCCLSKEPADRPTVQQLLQHSWVRQHMRALRP